MMHASSGPTIDVLLADRARFESWLSQLERKAGDLPPHIVARVRADYAGRLQRVLDVLAERADDLRAEAAELAERVTALEASLAAKRDARAEDELRAVVGEFDDAVWAERAAQHDAGIAALDTELRTRMHERDRAQELVASALRGAVPAPVPAPVEAAAAAPISVPAAAPVAPPPAPPQTDALELGATVAVAQAAPAVAPALPAVPPAVPPVVPPPVPPPTLPPAVAPPPSSRASAAVVRPPQLSIEAPVVEDGSTSREGIPDLLPSPSFDAPPRRTSQQTPFDEIAFLDTVVGAGSSRVSDQVPATTESVGDGLAPATEADAQRTLKCQECGWMNVPTEWYCEKCGGELSAF
jgi:hypothetical protein